MTTDITNDYDAISQCNKCGFCQVACPIFRATGHEAGVARGRLALMRAIIEDRVQWNDELAGPLFNCLRCGACTTNCFGSVPTADLIVKGRAQYLEKVGQSPIHKLLFERLLPYPGRLHMAARAVALGKNAGLSKLAGALGLLRVLGRDFARAENIVEKLPPTPFRGRIRPGAYPGSGKNLNVGYFVGCGVDIIQQDAGQSSFTLLRQSAESVTVLNNCCCGLPAWTYGDRKAAEKLAQKNLQLFSSKPFDLIVTDCSSCASFLKGYAGRFDSGGSAGTKIQDMVEFLDCHSTQREKPPGSGGKMVVTFHDPCHAVRGQGIRLENRRILNELPGIEFREMAESDWCCGGAGSYALSNYDLSMRVLDRKMENVAATGADVLVTSCPACMIQLAHGARRRGLDIRVRHISEMVRGTDKRPGAEFPETQKL